MITTRVLYSVKQEFVPKNEANIRAVMEAARAVSEGEIKYTAFRTGDAAFLHLAAFANEDAKSRLTGLPEFATFQTELKANIASPPDAQTAELVGSTFDWF